MGGSAVGEERQEKRKKKVLSWSSSCCALAKQRTLLFFRRLFFLVLGALHTYARPPARPFSICYVLFLPPRLCLHLNLSLSYRCGDMVAILISRPLAAAFVRPVDPALVPGYSDVVSKPMDLVRVRGGGSSHLFRGLSVLGFTQCVCVLWLARRLHVRTKEPTSTGREYIWVFFVSFLKELLE